MEYFPGSTTLELVHEVQKFMSKWASQNNSKDELSSCRCSMTSYGDIKTMKRNVLLMPHLCLSSKKKIFGKTLVIPRTWIRKKSGILLTLIDHEENGTETLN